MLGLLIGIANVALDVCAAKSLALNHEEGATREERDKIRNQRKLISDVRNGAYLLKRVLR